MPIRKPDIRELKTKVELKVIYNQNRGDANGDYAIFDIAPDAQNLRPGNYDTINNNPNIKLAVLLTVNCFWLKIICPIDFLSLKISVPKLRQSGLD